MNKGKYTDEQVDKMVKNVLADKNLTEKTLRDFGFEVKEYDSEELAYIVYSITEFGGLADKVKAAKAFYIVDQIAKFAINHNSYQDVGGFAMDILRDCKVINFKMLSDT